MTIPKKISPCPISEAIVEIRFESDIPSDAVFGVIYSEFKSEYKTLEKLPILQLPEIVRTRDQNLKFQPHYKLIKDDFLLQIGPNVLSIANINEYIGWDNFSSRIINTFSKIKKIAFIEKTTRLGIRYINFFELDIYENINLNFLLSDQKLIAEQITFKSKLTTGKFLSNLHILNNAHITINNTSKIGSLIDVDTYIQKEMDFFKIESFLEEGHIEEKKLFFKLLKNDFLEKFNPEY